MSNENNTIEYFVIGNHMVRVNHRSHETYVLDTGKNSFGWELVKEQPKGET